MEGMFAIGAGLAVAVGALGGGIGQGIVGGKALEVLPGSPKSQTKLEPCCSSLALSRP